MEEFEKCKTLNDIARQYFGKANYYNRQKAKFFLEEKGIEWKEWVEQKKYKPIKKCLYCGKELQKKNQKKFCGSSCAASYNNSLRCLSKHTKTEKKYCLNCGNELHGRQNKYCDSHCKNEYESKQYINRWKNKQENGLSGEYGISSYIKNYLLKKYNCKCEKCGWGLKNPYTNTVPLEIHHIDGNYKNNQEENLQLLCPNCHALTETYKSHNKKGRKGRNKYNM